MRGFPSDRVIQENARSGQFRIVRFLISFRPSDCTVRGFGRALRNNRHVPSRSYLLRTSERGEPTIWAGFSMLPPSDPLQKYQQGSLLEGDT